MHYMNDDMDEEIVRLYFEIQAQESMRFCRRYRMHKHAFLCIVEALGKHDDYFLPRIDATSI
ncbi:hypothetical protein MTR_2g071770 [Medicago truncatula]|uniref:Uncharacterized protein n=1 Tax=Medicago truncatula TaxID=3880 RepID=G7IJC4_MEDTR|nr:hypothetical protein MTR_2g071770 [Medicago truncatula]